MKTMTMLAALFVATAVQAQSLPVYLDETKPLVLTMHSHA